jgi:hypothetical protein
VVAVKVLEKHVGDGPDTPAEARVVEHVDDGTRRIRYGNAVLAPSHRHGPEQRVLVPDGQVEGHALDLYVSVTNPPSRDNQQGYLGLRASETGRSQPVASCQFLRLGRIVASPKSSGWR